MDIKINWEYVHSTYDTIKGELKCIPARGKRQFGRDEMDAELCFGDLVIAEIHTGDVESSNALCKEIVRRFNEFPEELKK